MKIPTNKKISANSLLNIGVILLLITILAGSPFYLEAQTTIGQGFSTRNNLPTEYTLLEPLPCIRDSGVNCTSGEQIEKINFKNYVQYVFNLVIALAAVASVFMIVWGGFQYMTSEIPGVKSDGLSKAKNAIYGLLLVLCSYIILRTIDPRLVDIPSTLVKPLELDYSKDKLDDFFTQLENEAKSYHIKSAELVEAARSARDSIKSLEQKKVELQNELENPSKTDSEVREMESQIRNIENKILEEKAKTIVSLTKSINNQTISNAITKIKQLSDPQGWFDRKGIAELEEINTIFDDAKVMINKTRDVRSAQVIELGIDGKDIHQHSNYSEILLDLERSNTIIMNTAVTRDFRGNDFAWVPGGKNTPLPEARYSALKNIESLSNQTLSNVKDPELQQQLLIKVEQSKSIITNKLGSGK